MELVLKDTQRMLAISEVAFGCPFNEALVHQVVVAYAAGSRQGTRAQKTHAEVRGSNRKPWRQKGTGRARSGSVRSPIWRSGGVTFAAHSQNHSKKVNKKMYRGALKIILSELIRQNRLIVIESFSVEAPKTKLLAQKLKNMDLLKNILIIISKSDNNLSLAARNLHKINICNTTSINPINLIAFDKVVITVDAIRRIEEMLI